MRKENFKIAVHLEIRRQKFFGRFPWAMSSKLFQSFEPTEIDN